MRSTMSRTLAFCLPVLGVALAAGPALAQEKVRKLKPQTIVAADVVRLDDLVDGVGEFGTTPLFRAPELGGVGAIRAERVLEAAKELGIEGLDTRGLMAVMVHRPSREVAPEETRKAVLEALSRRDPALAEAELNLASEIRTTRAPRDTSGPLTADLTEFEPRSGRFSARISAGGHPILTVVGQAEAMVQVALLNRPLSRGDAVQPGDVTIERRRRRDMPLGAAAHPDQLAGLAAQRPLAPGQVLRNAELSTPEQVEQNQIVMISYDSPGIALSLRGKALAAGAIGTVIQVQNLQSKRTFEAVVTGPGKVSARLTPRA